MQWYVLRSKRNMEEALWLQLDSRGFQTFYPQIRVKPINPRMRTMRPYFPGYLFVHAELTVVGQSIFTWLPYSQGLVTFGGDPAPVTEELLQAIRKRVELINAGDRPQAAGLQQGDLVAITDGPFAGYEAIFDADVAGDERVRVFLKLLQVQQVRLELPGGQIRPITRH